MAHCTCVDEHDALELSAGGVFLIKPHFVDICWGDEVSKLGKPVLSGGISLTAEVFFLFRARFELNKPHKNVDKTVISHCSD